MNRDNFVKRHGEAAWNFIENLTDLRRSCEQAILNDVNRGLRPADWSYKVDESAVYNMVVDYTITFVIRQLGLLGDLEEAKAELAGLHQRLLAKSMPKNVVTDPEEIKRILQELGLNFDDLNSAKNELSRLKTFEEKAMEEPSKFPSYCHLANISSTFEESGLNRESFLARHGESATAFFVDQMSAILFNLGSSVPNICDEELALAVQRCKSGNWLGFGNDQPETYEKLAVLIWDWFVQNVTKHKVKRDKLYREFSEKVISQMKRWLPTELETYTIREKRRLLKLGVKADDVNTNTPEFWSNWGNRILQALLSLTWLRDDDIEGSIDKNLVHVISFLKNNKLNFSVPFD